MSRVPLTDPKREQERIAIEKGKTPSPTDVGNEDRVDNKEDRTNKYDNSKDWENTEKPDMSTGWKNDKREDNGLPVLVAKEKAARIASGLAVKLAVCLLGEKVSEEVLQHQAEAFLAMDVNGLKASLERFAESESLYAETEVQAYKDAPAPALAPAPKNDDKETKTSEVAVEAAKTEEAPKAPEAPEAPKSTEAVKVSEDVKAPEAVKASEVKINGNSLFADLKPLASISASEALDSIVFAEEEEETTAPATTTASEKKGVRTLGSQPKLASEATMHVDLSKLWKTSPDIS